MPDLRGKSIPLDTHEYPPFEYREYPKKLGNHPEEKDEAGRPRMIVAENAKHEEELRAEFPHLPEPGSPDSPTPPAPATIMDENARLRAENEALRKIAADHGVTVPAPGVVDKEASDPWVDAELGGDAAQEAAANAEQPAKPGNKLTGKGKKK